MFLKQIYITLTCGLNFSDDTGNSWGRKNTILTNHQLTNLKNKVNNLKMIVNIINDHKLLHSEWHVIQVVVDCQRCSFIWVQEPRKGGFKEISWWSMATDPFKSFVTSALIVSEICHDLSTINAWGTKHIMSTIRIQTLAQIFSYNIIHAVTTTD